MNSLFLSFFISITAAFGASTPKNSTITNNNINIINDTPVTATSSIPEGGGEYGFDTTLKFNKTDPSDTNEYYYAFCFSPKLMKEVYKAYTGYYAPIDEVKMAILPMILLENDWVLIDDYSKSYNDNLAYMYSGAFVYVKQFGFNLASNSNLISLWICKKTAEQEFDYASSFEALSTINCVPGITNFLVLPDFFPAAGQKPVMHYDEPSGQYSADFTWLRNNEEMLPDETFSAKFVYKIRFSINTALKPLPPSFYEDSFFMFGPFMDWAEYDSETKQFVSEEFSPLISEYKDTIICRPSITGSKSYNFSIFGKFANAWKQTTFSNSGFNTYLYEGNDVATNYENAKLVSVDTVDGTDVDSFNVKFNFKHLNNDRVLQVNYMVKNISSDTKTFSIGSSSDVQIGNDDGAICFPFSDGSGFRMVSSFDTDEKQNHAQLNFWCQNTKDVTDVDHFWYGAYSSGDESYCTEEYQKTHNFIGYNNSNKKVIFTAEEVNRLSAYDKTRWQWVKDEETGLETPPSLDSAMAYSWTNQTLAPNESKTFSVLFSIGGPGSEDEALGDFTSIKTIDDTITYSGSENFNVTKITVDSNVLDSSCYKVDNAKKTITFLESANLKPGVKVSVYINDKEIKVRNNILPKGPGLIKITLNGSEEPVELKEGNSRVYLNEDGSRSEIETNRFFDYNPVTGKIIAQNASVDNNILIPEDPTVTNGDITLNVTGANTISKIDSAYPVTVSGGSNDTLTTNSISTNKLGVKGCKCTINAANNEPCISSVSDVIVDSGTLTLNSETVGIDISDGEELNLSGVGSLIINAKTGINAPDTNVIVSGKIDVTSSECGIKCDTLTIADGCDLTINNPAGKFLQVNKVIAPEGCDIIGGKIDAEGHFTPTEGATQLIIRKAAPVPVSSACFTHWILLALLVALIGFALILWFVFKIRNFKNKETNKLNIAPIVGFSLHLVGVIIAAVFMHCVACYVLLAVNLAILAGTIALYVLYKQKNVEQKQDQQKENKENK